MAMDSLVTNIEGGPSRSSPVAATPDNAPPSSTVVTAAKAAADAIGDPMHFLDGKYLLVVGDSHALGLFKGFRGYLKEYAQAQVVPGSYAQVVSPKWSGAKGDIVKSWRELRLTDRRNHTMRLRMHECEGPFGMMDALQPDVPREILPLDEKDKSGVSAVPDVVVFGYGTHYHRNYSVLLDHSVQLTAHIESRLGRRINRETPPIAVKEQEMQQPLRDDHNHHSPFFIYREMHATLFPTSDGNYEQRGDYDCVRLTQSQLQQQRAHPSKEPITQYFRQAGYAILDTFDLNADRPQAMVGSGDCSHIKPKSDLHRRYSLRLLALLSAEASFRR